VRHQQRLEDLVLANDFGSPRGIVAERLALRRDLILLRVSRSGSGGRAARALGAQRLQRSVIP
jgi:hypothetical protein